MSNRAQVLADRIEEGAAMLAAFVSDLSDAEWRLKGSPDSRTIGVLVHHVAAMYPIELDVIASAVAGNAITDVTWDVVARINAEHARQHASVSKSDALELLARNSRDMANAVRALSDADLDRAVPFSLSYGAPMTVQFIIEDHPMRHPWHHVARMRRTLGRVEGSRIALAR
jgi:DinB superfamily